MSAAVTFSFGSQRNHKIDNTARQMCGINVESADCRKFCSVQTETRRCEGVFVYAVIQSVAYSGYALPSSVILQRVI